MKIVMIILPLVISLGVKATSYFVSDSGNDGNKGTSRTAPWLSLRKVNATVAAGDSVFFRRGDTFVGTLIPPSGTSSLKTYFGAYGTGAQPIISGLTTLSTWKNQGGKIWASSFNAGPPNATTGLYLNTVVINNRLTAMGRYPNANLPGKGFLHYEKYISETQLTDSQLPTSPGFAGAEIVLRRPEWALQRKFINSRNWRGSSNLLCRTLIREPLLIFVSAGVYFCSSECLCS